MSLDDFIPKDDLPPKTRKFEHRILIGPDPKDPSHIVLTGIPLINDETNELIAWTEFKREKNKYLLL
ncbi:hypothetical protein [Candidatus Nitrosocosmicus franklandus]|nr:hypothetical protein [Candidatus Nitrosocosmicus franklandus]